MRRFGNGVRNSGNSMPISSILLSRSTLFDLDPALFDLDCESLKRRRDKGLSVVVGMVFAVPRYLTAEFESKIPCYLTASELKCKSSGEQTPLSPVTLRERN